MERFSIGQVSARTGMSVHALRFYEREGLLLAEPGRSAGGQRSYLESDIRWIIMCGRFREAGMPIADLRRYVELVRQGPGNEAERLELLRRNERQMREQVRRLEESLTAMGAKADLYEEHVRMGAASSLWTGDTPDCLALEASWGSADGTRVTSNAQKIR